MRKLGMTVLVLRIFLSLLPRVRSLFRFRFSSRLRKPQQELPFFAPSRKAAVETTNNSYLVDKKRHARFNSNHACLLLLTKILS